MPAHILTYTNDENHEMVEKHDVCNVFVGYFKNTKPDLTWLHVEPQGPSHDGYIELNDKTGLAPVGRTKKNSDIL